jgi:hypothetical protein
MEDNNFALFTRNVCNSYESFVPFSLSLSTSAVPTRRRIDIACGAGAPNPHRIVVLSYWCVRPSAACVCALCIRP